MSINTVENIEKGACQCRKCHSVFDQSEVEHVHREQFGQLVTYCVCPECGSTIFGLINYPVSEEHLIYKSKNFHKKDKKYQILRNYNINDFLPEEEE